MNISSIGEHPEVDRHSVVGETVEQQAFSPIVGVNAD